MNRQEAIHEAVERLCFDTKTKSLVVQYIEEKHGDVLHWLDLCELIVVENVPGSGRWGAAFAATTEADEYVKSCGKRI